QEAAVICKHCGMNLRTGISTRHNAVQSPNPPIRHQKRGLLSQLLRTRIGWKLIGLAVVVGLIVLGEIRTAIYDVYTGPDLPARSRDFLEATFKDDGYIFESISDEDGIDGRVGTPDNGWTWVYLMGPVDDLQYSAITVTLIEEYENAQGEYIIDFLVAMLGSVNAANDISDWLSEHEDLNTTHSDEIIYGRWNVSFFAQPQEGELVIRLDKRYEYRFLSKLREPSEAQ